MHGRLLRVVIRWTLATLALSISILLPFEVKGAPPCTLYKATDVANARLNVERHHWAQRIVAGWRRQVTYLMAQDRQFVDDMISETTPWPTYGQNCPVCVNKKSSMGECNLYRWNIAEPDKLICKYCNTGYPNSKYPETGTLICPKMGQTFTYYQTVAERAHPENKAGEHAFRWASWPVHTSWTGVIRSRRAGYVINLALPLAKLYAVTGEVRYAERSAWILDRFARVFPNYLFHSYNGTYADCPPAEAARELGLHPRAGRFSKDVIRNACGLHQYDDHAQLNVGFWGAGRYSCSGGDGGTILQMLVAFDLIRDARHPDDRSVLTPEMDRRIRDDLLLAGCEDSENWKDINNKCGPGRALSAATGILFKRPQSVRHALDGFQQLMDRCFHADGFCTESPSYSSMHLALMRDIPEILRGYSDPDGFQSADGKRIENLNPFVDLDRYRLALESMVRMLAPGRRYPIIGDTHHGAGLSTIWAEILADRYGDQYAAILETVQGKKLAEAGSEYALWYRDANMKATTDTSLPLHTEWFPGWHVAVLRAGDPKGDTAFYLNGNAMHGHRHYDTLGIIYYAGAKELASDRGYIWDDPRNAWTKSTLAHNIVTVDGGNQNNKQRQSHLELFASAPGIEVVQASANAYSQCSRYQRSCVLVQLPGQQSYVVDIFRVRGGELHQYGFNGNGKLIALSTPEPQPTDQKIKWLDNLRAVAPSGPFTATWEHQDWRLDMTMLNQIDQLIVADAPGWRSDRGSEINAAPIQQILASCVGTDPRMSSQYVSVIVPYQGSESPVRAARLVEADDKTGTVVVEVELAERTDLIVSSLDGTSRQIDSVSICGQFGFVSRDAGGRVKQAYLFAGTRLRCGDVDLKLEAPTTRLKVESVEDRTFHLTDYLPFAVEEDATQRNEPNGLSIAPGGYILAGGTGYEIESIGRRTITVRDYPVIECDEITLLHGVSWQSPIR